MLVGLFSSFRGLAIAAGVFVSASCSVPQADAQTEPRYLAFQVFTGALDPAVAPGGAPVLAGTPDADSLDAFAADLITRIGSTGTRPQRLALIFGPIAFDHSDEQVETLIATGFRIALERDVAIGFHLDDSIFWGRRTDLLSNPDNIERISWDGARSTGRRLDWGPQPTRAAPQMCINAPAIEAEVRRRGRDVVGAAIRRGLDELARDGHSDLFAGAIVGWETQIGRDFDTGQVLGFCALAHRGVDRNASLQAADQERIAAVRDFITLWAGALESAGVPANRIYAHVAFPAQQALALQDDDGRTSAERINFSPPDVAFGPHRRPGFSTYPGHGLADDIAREVRRHGGAPWASAEGANVSLGGDPRPSGMSMETYLARLSNRGAVLINVFGWGVGDADNGFRRAAESAEALGAYRKFLRGETLLEGEVTPSIIERLPAKIRRIQANLPTWVQRNRAQARVQPHLDALQRALAAQDLERAEAEVDILIGFMEVR